MNLLEKSLSEAAVLVVEDDPQLRELMQWSLEDEGLNVATAPDGESAVRQMSQATPGVLVLDMGLPGLDGAGVAAAMRAQAAKEIPILLITGDGNAAEKAERVGAYACLRKPFAMADLLARVREGLGAKGPRS